MFEVALAGQYVVVYVFVTKTVDPAALVEVETMTFVAVVRLLEADVTEL